MMMEIYCNNPIQQQLNNLTNDNLTFLQKNDNLTSHWTSIK